MVAGFFAVFFLAGAAFLATGLVVDFLAEAVDFTPVALAFLASCFLRRAALFLWIRPFLTALSTLLWAVEWDLAAGFLTKAFSALLRLRFVLLLRTVALRATRTRFLADLMMGIGISSKV